MNTTQLYSPIGKLPSEWQVRTLTEIAIKIGSGATPKGGNSVYLSSRENFALIRSQNVFDRFFSTDGLAFISDMHADQLKGVHLQSDDILLNITGDGITFGRACIVPISMLPACVNQHVSIIRVNKEICSPGYLLSYLTHPSTKKYIESFNAGGSRRAITKGHIESFQIPLPPLPEQHAIAHILGALDDKIELNRQMNKTLEELARAIFKSWFVDFDPVRAKIEGRQPFGMDAATAVLFPDSFEDSALGEIPSGWRVGNIGDIASNPRRTMTSESIASGTPYIGLEHMPRKSIALSEWGLSDNIISHKSLFRQGEILFGKLRPYFHKVGIAVVGGVCSTDILVILQKSSEWYGLTLFHVSSTELINFVDAASSGTKMPRTNWSDISRYEIAIPPSHLAEIFNHTVIPIVQSIRSNILQSQTLTELRDTLLPKLLSGELRVRDAERMLEEHAL